MPNPCIPNTFLNVLFYTGVVNLKQFLTIVIRQFPSRHSFLRNSTPCMYLRVGFSHLCVRSVLRVGPLIALFAMAIACGNIKPCLAAFGGDQFRKDQVSLVYLM